MEYAFDSLDFATPDEAVAVRRVSAELARLLGFEFSGQTRVATAVSEAVRQVVQRSSGGRARFRYVESDERRLVVELGPRGIPERGGESHGCNGDTDATPIAETYGRLVDTVEWVETREGKLLRISQRIPSAAPRLQRAALDKIAASLRRLGTRVGSDILEQQNRELLAALQELQRREDELRRLNDELADTNRGVVALYTQLERQAEELRRTEENLRLALDAGGMGTWQWEPSEERLKIDIAAHRLIGLPAESNSVALPLLASCFSATDARRLRHAALKAIRSGTIFQMELQLTPVAGEAEQPSPRWLSVRGAPCRDPDGTTKFVAGVYYEITEHKRYQRVLEEAKRASDSANRFKSDLLASVSHELRTPLAAVIGYSDLLMDRSGDAEDRGYLLTIRRNGQFLLEIINDILDISKIEAGRLEIRPATFDPHDILEDVRTLMSVQAEQSRTVLTTRAAGDLPRKISSDPQRVRQILLNLVGNAVKFTQQGEVDVCLRLSEHSPRHLQVAVRDTGPGIAPERIQELFEPFVQVREKGHRTEGTGLGLAISRRLARMMGGDITVVSRHGQGSCFTLTLDTQLRVAPEGARSTDSHPQRDRQEAEREGSKVTVASGPAPLSGATILVVDDLREIRFIAEHMIRRAGGEAISAADGRQAVDLLEQCQADGRRIEAVLMDMQMPDMDGYEATRRLRESGFEQPIVAVTAGAMSDERDRCLAVGCNEYMSKPLDYRTLVSLVRRLLNR